MQGPGTDPGLCPGFPICAGKRRDRRQIDPEITRPTGIEALAMLDVDVGFDEIDRKLMR